MPPLNVVLGGAMPGFYWLNFILGAERFVDLRTVGPCCRRNFEMLTKDWGRFLLLALPAGPR
ncbi:protein of unknown function (plasmid) [Caballeronia sp. S22]